MLTHAEIMGMQTIIQNLQNIIKIGEDARKRKLENWEKTIVQNNLANNTVEFYNIANGIQDRLLNEGVKNVES